MFKVALIGPESTGKSELSEALAAHYKCDFVPEYARTYVEQLQQPYTFDDVCIIAQKQIEFQNVYLENNNSGIVFFDTELIITKVWFEYCFHAVPEFVLENLKKPFFDLYLLCYPDLPWVFDLVREHGGDERMYFYNWYESEIKKSTIPYFVIKGLGEERLNNAIQAINDLYIKINKYE